MSDGIKGSVAPQAQAVLVEEPDHGVTSATDVPPARADDPSVGEGGRGDARPRWQIGVAGALTLAALAPIIAVLLQRWGRPYLPVQDQGVFDLRIRDVWSFSANTPLAGPYSRFGWDHPGPTVFYLLAVVSGVLGQAAWASIVGNALLQAVAVVWIARLSWKAGGLRWMIPWLAVVVLTYWGTGPWIWQQLWNPHIALPFFALFLLQCTLVARGDARRLPGFAFVGSFVVQTHVGYSLLVVVTGAWALWRLTRSLHSEGRRFFSKPVVLVPGIVLAVVWFIPVVIDPILHFPGNLARLGKFYAGLDPNTKQPLLGVHNALGYMAAEFRWLPPWLGGHDPLDPLTGLAGTRSVAWLLIPVVLLAAANVLGRRSGSRELKILAEMSAVVFVAGLVSLALLRGVPDPYLFYWRITIGAATVVLTLFVIVSSVAASAHLSAPQRRIGSGVALSSLAVTVLIASSSMTNAVAATNGPISPMEPIAASVLHQLDTEHQPDGSILLRYWGSTLAGLQGGLADQLIRQGDRVYFDPDLGHQFGYGRTARPAQVHSVWYVTEESQLYSLMSKLPGATVLAVSHPLPSGQQAHVVALQRQVATELGADGKSQLDGYLGNAFVWDLIPQLPNVSRAQLNALANLNAKVRANSGCLCSVIAFPSNEVPAHLPTPQPASG